MDWIMAISFLAGLSCRGTAMAWVMNAFLRNESLSNTVPSDTTPISVTSVTACARTCRSTVTCAGFYFCDSYHHCIFDVGVVFSNFTSDASVSYFQKTGTTESSSTVTPSAFTAVSSTNCPTEFIEDIIVLGSSESYPLKIFHEGGLFRNQTQEICQNSSMNLFRPNDLDKVDAVMGFLTSCTAAYGRNGYWTDAERQMDEAGQPWRSSDGSAVVMGAWSGDTPENQMNEYCARMERGRNYKLSDIWCDKISSTWGFICE